VLGDITSTLSDYLGITDAISSGEDTAVAKAQAAAQQTINQSLPAAQSKITAGTAAGITAGATAVENQLLQLGAVFGIAYLAYRFLHHKGVL